MRKGYVLFIALLIILVSCSSTTSTNKLGRVALLVEDTVDDKGWNEKGYQGLLNIQTEMGVDVFFEEKIDTLNKAEIAVAKLNDKGVNLIFGHGRIFADFFSQMNDSYPHIHFVSFNGGVSGDNITSLHFKSEALGFFAGMAAGEVSASKKVGIIAAFPWQPEVEGFKKGVLHQHQSASVYIDYVGDWGDTEKAFSIFQEMQGKGVDVFYPAGDGFHVPLIQEIKKQGLFGVGFVSDQSDLGNNTILTSTVQHVDSLYKVVAERFSKGDLKSGNIYYDFSDGVVSLGAYSEAVPKDVQEKINGAIAAYKETGNLPEHE